MVVRLGPAHTCRRRDGADSTGKAFIIIDIPHSYPVTFIAAHAVTSEPLMRSSPMGGVLVSGGCCCPQQLTVGQTLRPDD